MSLWIEASAGTGKTHFISSFIAEQNSTINIVVLTHTNAAVNELKNRITQNNVNIYTIHSFCYQIVKKIYNYHILNQNYSTSEYDEISYTKYKLRNNMIDYNDIIDIASLDDLIDLNIDILIIDEAQDTSYKQWQIIKKIYTQNNIELIILGDEKQLIYTFNGSSIDIYRAIKEYFSFQEIIFTHSYRHCQAIVDYINQYYTAHSTNILYGYVEVTYYTVMQSVISLNKKLTQPYFLHKYNRYSDKQDILILVDARDKLYRKLIQKINCRDYALEARYFMIYYLFPYKDEYFPYTARLFDFSSDEITSVYHLKHSIVTSVLKNNFIMFNNTYLAYTIQNKLKYMFHILLKKHQTLFDLIKYVHNDIQHIFYNEFIQLHPPDIYTFSLYLKNIEKLEYKIMTIHQAKGLQAPIVYIPFHQRHGHYFFEQELYKRMKYVAITRAESYLWINNV